MRLTIALFTLLSMPACSDSSDTKTGNKDTSETHEPSASDDTSNPTDTATEDTATDGGSPDDTAAESTSLGSVLELGDCESLNDLSCQRLRVSCPDLPDLDVDLFLADPTGGETPRGVVILGSGLSGTTPYKPDMMTLLADRGFRVFNRVWQDDGWQTGEVGMAHSACRYATLLTWLRAQQPAQLPLCATGNSGGAAELSYALAHWDMGSILDLAVPSGGPPMARLDLICADGPEWQETCLDAVPEDVCGGTPTCSFQSGHFELIDLAFSGSPCTEGRPKRLLREHSILSPDAQLAYPETYTHFIFGSEDCSAAIPQGYLYANAVTSEKTIEVAEAPHSVFASAAGESAIVTAIDGGCTCRHPDCQP